MKYSLITLATAVFLTACSDKPTEQTAAPAPVADAITYSPFLTDRPTSLPTQLVSTDSCSVDMVDGAPAKESTTVQDKSKLALQGWAADTVSGTLPKEVYLEVNGPSKAYIKADLGISRPDVAEHFKNPALTMAGWTAFANLSALPAGTYTVKVIQSTGETGSACDAQRALVLVATP